MLRPVFPWQDPAVPMRLDRYMAAALHDPECGYYARRIRDVGPRGDFSTAATLGPALGRAVARWAAGALAATGCRDLIELGPGNGALAAAVRAGLPLTRRLGTRLHLVETSAPLRERQRERLGGRVRWHNSAAAALDACGGRACLFSNEFVDAFPVRRFRLDRGRWLESWVLPGREIWRESEDLPDSSVFRRDWPDGQLVEVHESFHEWLRQTLPRWQRGRMLTIDYGAEIAGLCHRRPGGSLRGYFHHLLVEGDDRFARAGHQDLTADVNFTDLAAWCAPHPSTLATQAEFLRPHLRAGDPVDRFVADPDGAGGGFLVLETACGA